MKINIYILSLLLLIMTPFATAQDTKEDLSQQAANPLADLISLPFQNNLNLQTQLYYNVVRPDFGPEWQWRVQAQFLLPKTIFSKK